MSPQTDLTKSSMGDSVAPFWRRKSWWEGVRIWIQPITVAAVAIFGVWQFWLKEVVWPAAAPVNLTADVSLKGAGSRAASLSGSDGPYEAIELVITAHNPSSRNLYLLSNIWVARGITIKPQPNNDHWEDVANKQIARNRSSLVGKHYVVSANSIVAAGYAFNDHVLHPSESVSQSVVFCVPEGVYDLIDVAVALPTISQENAAEVTWTINPDSNVKLQAYRLNGQGNRIPVDDLAEAFADPQVQLQTAEASRQLSLWRTKEE